MTAKMRGILLVICLGLLLFLHVNSSDISREEYLKLKRHLKRVNKPALKTIKTKYGDIFDCVDIYKQPAFDHPLLKNHTLQMIPSSLLTKHESTKNSSHNSDDGGILAKIIEDMDGGCPEGTVPIRRTRMKDLLRAPFLFLHGKKYPGNATYDVRDSMQHPRKDISTGHHYAVIRTTGGTFYGTKAAINLWGQRVADPHMFSLIQFWVLAGEGPELNSLEVGWIVYPGLYGDQLTRLFAFWTNNGYTNGYYNSGYMIVNRNIPLGITYPQMSVYDGPQASVTLQLLQEPNTGKWWLLWGEDNGPLGYFPREIFPVLGHGPATRLEWGGETFTPEDTPPYPPMGSGHFAAEGFGKAGYVRWIRVYDQPRNAVDAPLDTEVFADKPGCYQVVDPRVLYGGQVNRVFFYGGPGGNC